MSLEQNWRMNDVRLSLKTETQLTQTEFDLLLALGASTTKVFDMSREQLAHEFPLAFQIQKVADHPKPDVSLLRSVRRRIEALPIHLQQPVWALAVACIATLTPS